MSKKFLSYEGLKQYDSLIKASIEAKSDSDHTHPIATTTTTGFVMVDGTAGVGVNTENGNLYIKQATTDEIDGKEHSYKPITPDNLDYAVKAGLVNNANALTSAEKTTATQWIGALSKKCIHKETGDITELAGSESCRYVIGNEVTGMPIENEWWMVDFISNGNTDAAMTAYPMNVDAPIYVRYLVNNVWSDWKELVTFDSNGYLRVPGLIAPEYVTASDGESNITLYPSGIGSDSNDFWIKHDGGAWFTEVYVGTKDNYTQLKPPRFADNITGGVDNDTISFWIEQGSGYGWFSEQNQIIDQPNQYGFLVNYVGDADVFQIFHEQSSGDTYFRSGDNINDWFRNWAKVVITDSDGDIHVNGVNASHVEVSDGNTTMGLYSNGLGANGDAVWIDQAGDAYFTEVNIGTKGNYKKAATQDMLGRTTSVDAADTNYTTYMARGEALYPATQADTVVPSANGTIVWFYE